MLLSHTGTLAAATMLKSGQPERCTSSVNPGNTRISKTNAGPGKNYVSNKDDRNVSSSTHSKNESTMMEFIHAAFSGLWFGTNTHNTQQTHKTKKT